MTTYNSYRDACVKEWQQLVSKYDSGHESGWPHGVYIRDSQLFWEQIGPWLEQNVRRPNEETWAFGRFELLFKYQEDCAQFILTWM